MWFNKANRSALSSTVLYEAVNSSDTNLYNCTLGFLKLFPEQIFSIWEGCDFYQADNYNCGQDVPRLLRRRVPYPQSAGVQSPADCGTAMQCPCPRWMTGQALIEQQFLRGWISWAPKPHFRFPGWQDKYVHSPHICRRCTLGTNLHEGIWARLKKEF